MRAIAVRALKQDGLHRGLENIRVSRIIIRSVNTRSAGQKCQSTSRIESRIRWNISRRQGLQNIGRNVLRNTSQVTDENHWCQCIRLIRLFVIIYSGENLFLNIACHLFIPLIGLVMSPLQYGTILASDCNEEFIVVTEATFSDVEAVTDVRLVITSSDVAWISKQTHNTVFVRRGDGSFVATSRAAIDVSAIAVLWPNALHGPPRDARPCCPVHVFQRR